MNTKVLLTLLSVTVLLVAASGIYLNVGAPPASVSTTSTRDTVVETDATVRRSIIRAAEAQHAPPRDEPFGPLVAIHGDSPQTKMRQATLDVATTHRVAEDVRYSSAEAEEETDTIATRARTQPGISVGVQASAPAFATAPVAAALPLPLAFQKPEPEIAQLSVRQIQELDTLRAQFVKDIDGPGKNPYDPRYAKRWVDALSENDRRLRLFFGPAFVDHIALVANQTEYAAARRAAGLSN